MRRTLIFALPACCGLLLGQAPPGQPEHVPVYIEDSPAALERAEEARDLRAQGRLTDAVAVWQRVMEDYVGKLVPVSDQLYIEVARWARREVANDAELLRLYREIHGPEAERALAEARKRRLDAAALESVVRRYFLTTPAQAAGLDLVALYLERADPSAAATLLDELADHPDHAQQRVRFHALAAVTAMLLDDAAAAATHREALRGLGAEAEVAEIAGLTDLMHPPRRARAPEPAVLQPDTPLLDRALWTVELDAGEDAPRQNYPGGTVEPALSTAPVADGDRLYLNELTRVSAVDRYSGRELWSFESAAPTGEAASGVIARMGRSMSDRRGVLVIGDRIIAVVGQATNWPVRVGPEDRGTALAALDRETGEVLWRVDPQSLDPSLERSYFQGTPLAAYDRVYALVRRNQASGFQDVFVLAVDAATGRLLWRRHVSSAVTASRYATGAPPQMALIGGTIYVGDSLAAVSAIDGRSGAVEWTRVLVDANEAGSRGLNVSGDEEELDAAPPVLVEAGLLVPPGNGGGRVSVLDPETGRDRRPFPASSGELIEYLLPAGRDVLAIGRHVALLDGATLETKWTTPVAPSSPHGTRGIASVTRDLVVAPTPERVLLLSLADGREVGQLPVDGGGNLLALDGQLVLADTGSVRSYMPWERAYEALSEQVRREPTNPRPGLAMAHLAASVGLRDAVVEGSRAALAALDALALAASPAEVEPAQRDVFTQLLAFGEPTSGLDADLREELLGDAATISAGPEQEVAYHLALGSLLEEVGRPIEAVEHYQAVVMSPLLSSQLYTRGESSRQAGLEAQRRLAEAVQRNGREVYQPFEQEAAHQLAELVARGADAQALSELAAKYPLADAAPRALLTAGRMLAEQGRPGDAIAPLRRAYSRAAEADVLAAAAGRLAEVYEQLGRPRLAVQWLRRVAREHPSLRPLRDGAPVGSDAWIGELAVLRGSAGVAPPLRLPFGTPRAVAGALLTPRAGAGGAASGDRFLVRNGGTVRLYTLPDLSLAWEATLPTEDLELLALDQEHTLLWSASGATLWSFDTATGEPAYEPIVATRSLAPLGDLAQRDADRPEAERRFLEMIDVAGPVRVVEGRVVLERPARAEGYLIGVGESVIVLAERGGGIVGIDRHTGRSLWHHAGRIEQIATLDVGEDAVVVSGIRNIGTEALGGAVQVLDLLTGEPRLPLLEDKDTPQWTGMMMANGVAAVAVATADHVTAHRLSDGVVLWRVAVTGQPLTGRGWASADLLLLEMNGGSLLAIEPGAGEVVQRLELGPEGRGGLRDVALVDGHWQVAGTSQAFAIDADGQVIWRDAIRTLGDHLVGQWISDRHVLLLGVAEDEMQRRQAQILLQPGLDAQRFVIVGEDGEDGEGLEGGSQKYDVHALDRLTGVIEREVTLTLPANERLTVGTLLDNHALLRGAGRVIVLPGAVGP